MKEFKYTILYCVCESYVVPFISDPDQNSDLVPQWLFRVKGKKFRLRPGPDPQLPIYPRILFQIISLIQRIISSMKLIFKNKPSTAYLMPRFYMVYTFPYRGVYTM